MLEMGRLIERVEQGALVDEAAYRLEERAALHDGWDPRDGLAPASLHVQGRRGRCRLLCRETDVDDKLG